MDWVIQDLHCEFYGKQERLLVQAHRNVLVYIYLYICTNDMVMVLQQNDK